MLTLFIVKINSISRAMPSMVQYSLYAADLQISVSSCNLSICERRLQVANNSLVKCSEENGFNFYTEKTVCICFSRKRGVIQDPYLTLNNIPIHVSSSSKWMKKKEKRLTFLSRKSISS